jgi:Na+/melibiose symporter-like transporter
MSQEFELTTPQELSPPPPVEKETSPPHLSSDRFRVGTLTYTKAGLVTLFIWLMWGDFCFTLMETVIPSILPLKLKSLDASNKMMGLLVTTIPSAMNFMVNPIVSFRSDRYRSRWGRRIPFLFWATPFVTLFLILIGFSDKIGGPLHTFLSQWIDVSPNTVILGLIAVLMVCFQFFNMFIASVYYYLFNDVVPEAYLARCMALFRVVGSLAGSLYSFFIYKYAATHMQEIFLGAGILYFIAFITMCWKVKEGQYPPPPPNLGQKHGVFAAAKTYMVECFTHRYYWCFFLMSAAWQVSGCINVFSVFLNRDSLGLNLDQLGKIGGIAGFVTTLLLYPAGMLSDRYHPIRVIGITMLFSLLMAPVGLIYLFWDFSPQTVLIITIIMTCVSLPVGVLFAAAQLPMYMKLLPKDRYGQFGSADAMVRSISTIIFGVLAGVFIDQMKRWYGDPWCYRFIPVWTITFQAIALFFFYFLYRGWQRHGGAANYVPPPTSESFYGSGYVK